MLQQNDFIIPHYSKDTVSGNFTWSSPSNIALIKYWGKENNQIPANPSVSFTLKNCKTTTTLKYKKLEQRTHDFSFDLFFEGLPKETFKPKIKTFFERIHQYLPFLKEYHFIIDTKNTFPHSSGIASSASGMCALAMGLMSLEKTLFPEMSNAFFFQKASLLARLGSGSACRSTKGFTIVWGKSESIKGSSNLFGIEYPYKIHDVFKTYQDTILLVDMQEKKVSSTLGHNLMNGHPFAEKRFEQAEQHLQELMIAFETGNLLKFIKIVELEALTLHAMMMTSNPYFILMKPNTIEIINKIWTFREKTTIPICFTLDAGANVHLLYPKEYNSQITEFIQKELIVYCQNSMYIYDEIGLGSSQI